MELNLLLGVFTSLFLGVWLGYVIRQQIIQRRAGTIEAKLKSRLEKVQEEAKKIVLEAKEKAVEIINTANEEEKKRKLLLDKLEERLLKREELLDKKDLELDSKEKEIKIILTKIQSLKTELEKLQKTELDSLEKIAKLTLKEAKEELFKKAEAIYKEDLLEAIKKLETSRREELDMKAKEILVSTIQRYSRTYVGDITTSIVNLPSEDIKGRIIGKEGRNIRHFERLTGVDLIVDEAPETITLSSFDPVRREIARLALEKLIQDGRIQPAKIEEKVIEAQKELKEKMKKAGEEAIYEAGVLDLPLEIVHLLGRLMVRTSYGQNVLNHSIEVAILAGALAAELGAKIEVVKKAGLLHDIGKAVDQEIEGTHLELGRRILQKYKIDEEIIKAMQSHHEDYPAETLEAAIITAADAISASRPGARKETLEVYLKRLANLEAIATSFEGVEKAYAIQAGRELRVFVTPEKLNDLETKQLARQITEKIEEEIDYPGEIKVTLIRETKVIEYAK